LALFKGELTPEYILYGIIFRDLLDLRDARMERMSEAQSNMGGKTPPPQKRK